MAEKKDENLLFLTFLDNKITAADPTLEKTFSARNPEDFKFYLWHFPNSKYTNKVFVNAVINASREEIPAFVKLMTRNKYTLAAEKRYVQLSSTVVEAGLAAKLYPELKHLAEKKAAKLVTNFDDAQSYARYFENSRYADYIFRSLMRNASKEELPILIDLYPYSSEIENAKLIYLEKSQGIDEIIEAAKKYPAIKKNADEKVASIARTNRKYYDVYLSAFPQGDYVSWFKSKIHEEFLATEREVSSSQLSYLLRKDCSRIRSMAQFFISSSCNFIVKSIRNEGKGERSIATASVYSKGKYLYDITFVVEYGLEWKLDGSSKATLLSVREGEYAGLSESAKSYAALIAVGAAVSSLNQQPSGTSSYGHSGSSSYDYSSNDKDHPCYHIIDKEKLLFGISRNVHYKIRCKNGDTRTVFYDPDYKKPYTAGGFTDLRKKSFDEAAKDACDCW